MRLFWLVGKLAPKCAITLKIQCSNKQNIHITMAQTKTKNKKNGVINKKKLWPALKTSVYGFQRNTYQYYECRKILRWKL